MGSSGLVEPKVRCDRERLNTTDAAWKSPGDLNRLFASWATEARFSRFDPKVLSSPGGKYGGMDGPWIMTLDSFLTERESDDLARGGKLEGFEASTNQGVANDLGEREKVVS